MRLSTLALFSSACIVSGAALVLARENSRLPVVPAVDLKQYQGKWYEIARLPARFERKCARDVTAEYTLRPDGKVQVVNTCIREDGSPAIAKAVARKRDTNAPASKLKVTFFWPFSGDYWILDLDPRYQWALVGTPDRRYLWILSRTSELPQAIYQSIVETARARGFDVNRLLRTRQSSRSSTSSRPE